MKNTVPYPGKKAIQEEAALWLAKIDQGALSEEQKQQLVEWLNSDSRHRDTLREMARLWGAMDSLSVLAELFPQADRRTASNETSQAPPSWLREHPVGAPSRTSTAGSGRALRSFQKARWRVAAGVGAGLGLALMFGAADFLWGTKPTELVYQADLGQVSRVALKDGSVMTLNTQSKTRVRINDRERKVYLIGGEAHFEVAKNRAVPFTVYAGNGFVRAVGTQFSVRLEQQMVDVMVAEGTVKVVAGLDGAENPQAAKSTASRQKSLTTLNLAAGGIANYSNTIRTYSYIKPEALAHKLAWKSGRWIFEGETLEQVIAEANRYTNRKIEIVDPALADLRVGGYFKVGEIDPLLNALEVSFGIKVTEADDRRILLSSQ
jgi:transmembrane sensor